MRCCAVSCVTRAVTHNGIASDALGGSGGFVHLALLSRRRQRVERRRRLAVIVGEAVEEGRDRTEGAQGGLPDCAGRAIAGARQRLGEVGADACEDAEDDESEAQTSDHR